MGKTKPAFTIDSDSVRSIFIKYRLTSWFRYQRLFMLQPRMFEPYQIAGLLDCQYLKKELMDQLNWKTLQLPSCSCSHKSLNLHKTKKKDFQIFEKSFYREITKVIILMAFYYPEHTSKLLHSTYARECCWAIKEQNSLISEDAIKNWCVILIFHMFR